MRIERAGLYGTFIGRTAFTRIRLTPITLQRSHYARSGRLALSSAIVLLRLSTAIQANPLSDFDRKAAEQHYEKQNSDKSSLHAAGQFPDGAKGVTYSVTGTGVALRGPPFGKKNDWAAWVDYCAYESLVLAKNIDSTPILSEQKDIVYTVSHFEVLETIKSDAPLYANQSILTYRLGGEIKDDGEVLRFETPAPAYKTGEIYLLLLNRQANATQPQYVAQDVITVAVRHSRIYPSAGDWAGFLSGTELSKAIATLKHVASMKACDSR